MNPCLIPPYKNRPLNEFEFAWNEFVKSYSNINKRNSIAKVYSDVLLEGCQQDPYKLLIKVKLLLTFSRNYPFQLDEYVLMCFEAADSSSSSSSTASATNSEWTPSNADEEGDEDEEEEKEEDHSNSEWTPSNADEEEDNSDSEWTPSNADEEEKEEEEGDEEEEEDNSDSDWTPSVFKESGRVYRCNTLVDTKLQSAMKSLEAVKNETETKKKTKAEKKAAEAEAKKKAAEVKKKAAKAKAEKKAAEAEAKKKAAEAKAEKKAAEAEAKAEKKAAEAEGKRKAAEAKAEKKAAEAEAKKKAVEAAKKARRNTNSSGKDFEGDCCVLEQTVNQLQHVNVKKRVLEELEEPDLTHKVRKVICLCENDDGAKNEHEGEEYVCFQESFAAVKMRINSMDGRVYVGGISTDFERDRLGFQSFTKKSEFLFNPHSQSNTGILSLHDGMYTLHASQWNDMYIGGREDCLRKPDTTAIFYGNWAKNKPVAGYVFLYANPEAKPTVYHVHA